MKGAKFVAVAAAAALVAGCVSRSRSEVVQALPEDVARDGRVAEIVLTKGDIDVSPEFDDIFRQRVQAKLDACATGTRSLRLEARVDRLDKANPVVTAVLAGANVLRGSARIVDPATGETVGDYEIGQTVIGGRAAVVVMAEAEEQMSDGFGAELCAKAFGAPADPAAGAPAAGPPENSGAPEAADTADAAQPAVPADPAVPESPTGR